jgi:hypothetical protein
VKFNPFRPGSMVTPGMFVGRLEEMDTLEQALYQTRHENPQHFLIEGERGIGKSSLLLLIEGLANGSVPSDGETTLRFLTAFTDLSGAQSQLDIVRCLVRQLRDAINQREPVKRKAAAVWEFLSKWEVMGVRYRPGEDEDPEDARDDLVNQVVELFAKAGDELDGIFFIIDEADGPSVDAQLGAFIKLFTERLTRRNCNRVLLGLAGLPSTIPKMRASHDSSPRVVEVLRLEPLTPDERKQVVRRGLKEGASRNGFETKITDDALELIADLSEGYPHFVQQFAHSAFAEDSDNVIDASDVTRGAFKENGALMQLGHKYFSEMYHAKIASEDYRRVLDTMAAHGDQWVAKKDIIRESGVSETSVTNAVAALKDKNIILFEEGRRGMYRLPTKSFAAWINAIRSVEEKQGAGGPNLFSAGS